jgi:hypothetical protein
MPPLSKQKQISEIVKCGKDPAYFINRYVQIQHPMKGRISFHTFPFQDDCLQQFNDHRFNVVVKSRQLGLSTLTAAYAVWLAMFRKDKSILVIATKLAVAQNFIKKVKVALSGIPQWMWITEITAKNTQAIEFSNGSQIKAVPTSDDAGRSEALSLLIVDEAAFIRNFDELWKGLYPTLSTGGRAILVSTPNGTGGQYYDIYHGAEQKSNEFNAIKLPWDVHPERDDAWFQKEARNLNKQQIAQELLCDFQASGDTFLSTEDIERLQMNIRSPIEKWGPENAVWVWKYFIQGHNYVISSDVARGDGSDYSTFHVIDTTESEVVAEFRGKVPPDQLAVLLSEAGRRYGDAVVCPESNTYGYAVLMKLREMNYKNIYFAKEKDKFNAIYGDGAIGKAGFSTQGASRAQILTKLEEMIRNNRVDIYSSRLVSEFKTFVWSGSKAQAQRGKNDDLVMSLAIGLWLYEYSSKKSSKSIDINSAMLAAFGVNKQQPRDSKPRSPYSYEMAYLARKGMPVEMDESHPAVSGSVDFKWLLS